MSLELGMGMGLGSKQQAASSGGAAFDWETELTGWVDWYDPDDSGQLTLSGSDLDELASKGTAGNKMKNTSSTASYIQTTTVGSRTWLTGVTNAQTQIQNSGGTQQKWADIVAVDASTFLIVAQWAGANPAGTLMTTAAGYNYIDEASTIRTPRASYWDTGYRTAEWGGAIAASTPFLVRVTHDGVNLGIVVNGDSGNEVSVACGDVGSSQNVFILSSSDLMDIGLVAYTNSGAPDNLADLESAIMTAFGIS